MTHTYAILEVTPMAWTEIKRELEKAGYEHAFHDDNVIDMHGIAVQPKKAPQTTGIEVGTILSARTKEGMVELAVNGERAQLDLSKAREVHRNIGGAIEAAISDQLIHHFMTEKLGLDDEHAARVLLDFREMRQGSRGVVFPT